MLRALYHISTIIAKLLTFVVVGVLTLVVHTSISRYLCEEDHDCVIIHEVFDGQAPLEKGERELDKAMLARHSTIVIEPHQLGLFIFCCIIPVSCSYKIMIL